MRLKNYRCGLHWLWTIYLVPKIRNQTLNIANYTARTHHIKKREEEIVGITWEHNKPSRKELLFEHNSYESNRRNDFCICACKPCVCGHFLDQGYFIGIWVSLESIRIVCKCEFWLREWGRRERRDETVCQAKKDKM